MDKLTTFQGQSVTLTETQHVKEGVEAENPQIIEHLIYVFVVDIVEICHNDAAHCTPS